MVSPRLRSTSAKAHVRKTPRGKISTIYRPKKPSKAVCAICKMRLAAVPKRSPVHMGKLAKTEKRPERMYGGVLCHNCLQSLLKERIRLQSGALQKEDISLVHLKYLDQMKG